MSATSSARPLTLMLSPLEDLLSTTDGKLPAEEKEKLSLIHSNGLRLLKLVNNLLDFSRIEAGRVQAVYEPADLAVYTAELAGVFRSAIEKAGLKLKVDCPSLPEHVYIDKEMWEKIVLNLLSNAFKFTFEGEIAVSLQWCGDHVELDVKDTGIGIAPEAMPHLFERFHRIQGVKARTHEGTGIGLALVQELARLHGGAVQVVSEPGKGTTFTVSIPTGSTHLPQERIGAARTLASTALGANSFVEEALKWLPEESVIDRNNRLARDNPQESVLTTPQSNNPKVLVVDDNADMRHYIQSLLSRYYEVEVAADGRAALESVRRSPPDLVLTDIMMPVMDGFELLRALRDNPDTKLLPIILLSARAGEEARVEGLDKGADDYLIKPFNASELIARVRTHLELALMRKKAEEKLRESEERFRAVQENSLDRFTILKPFYDDQGEIIDFTYIYQNAQAARTAGRRPEELIGLRMTEIFPAFPQSRFFAMYKLAIETGQATEFEERYQVDGVDDWFCATVTPIPDGIAIATQIITERKKAEEDLKMSEERLREIAQAARIGFFEYNVTKSTAYWSQQHYEIFGYEPGSPITWERWRQSVHPEDRERVLQKAARLLEWDRSEGQVLVHKDEYRIIRSDGTAVWLESDLSVDVVAGETILRGSVRDITERKNAEEALRQSEERLRLASSVPSIVLSEVDMDLRYLWILNPHSDFDMTPIIGKRDDELDSSEDAKKLTELKREALRSGTFQRVEWSISRSDGKHYYDMNLRPRLDNKGQVVGLTTAAIDITERKKAEEMVAAAHRQIQSIIDNTPAIVYAFDLEERFVMANTALAELLNSTPEQMIGKRRHEFMPKEDADWHEANDRQVIEAGRALEFEEYSQLPGRSITWLTTKFPLRDAQGRIYAVAGISADISERKKAEEELRRYASELEAFNYSVTHDLKQPLRALESFSGLLAEEYRDKLDERGKDYLNRVIKASQYMSQLTDDMLKLSRINRADMFKDQVDLSLIAESIIDELKTNQPERKAEINIAPDLMAVGDKNLLAIAMRNLLENAWKFTRKCPQTQLAVGTMEKDGERVYFIRDNGIGFDMRYKDKLFQPFQRLTTDKDYPGTGIGLAIVQRVIHRHGGKIMG